MTSTVDKNIRELVEQFTVLLATIRALLRNRAAGPVLLDSYHSMGEQILLTSREAGLTAEELMEMERQLAHLRLALEEAAKSPP